MKEKVLLLGANGQLGVLIASSVPAEFTLFPFSSKELDITDSVALASVLKEVAPAIIINAAAYTQVDKAQEQQEQAYAVNKIGPELLASLSSNNTRIIHISTDFVFDGQKRQPYLTTDTTSPESVYGQSKLAGEQVLLNIAPERTTIIRTAWLYSAHGKNFMNTMLQLMANKDELSIVADQKGTPTSAQVLAEVVWKFASQDVQAGIFHWTDREAGLPGAQKGEDSETETSWYDFACAIQTEAINLGLLQKKIPLKPISTAEYPTPATRPAYSVLDKSRSYTVLGFNGRSWLEELRVVLQSKVGH